MFASELIQHVAIVSVCVCTYVHRQARVVSVSQCGQKKIAKNIWEEAARQRCTHSFGYSRVHGFVFGVFFGGVFLSLYVGQENKQYVSRKIKFQFQIKKAASCSRTHPND